MKKTTVHYTIAEPCHESWAAMTPTAGGRFCDSCAKPVIDFTSMTDSQVLRLLAEAKEPVCGRMTTVQMGRGFTHYEVQQVRAFSLRALVLGTALTTFSALNTYAQGQTVVRCEVSQVEQVNAGAFMAMDTIIPPVYAIPKGQREQAGTELPVFTVATAMPLIGRVVDLYGNPIQGAAVTISNEHYEQLATTLANEEGLFSIPLQNGWNVYTIVVFKEGYAFGEFLAAEQPSLNDLYYQLPEVIEVQPIIMGKVMVQPQGKE